MQPGLQLLSRIVTLVLATFILNACDGSDSPQTKHSPPPPVLPSPGVAPLPSDEAATGEAIRFLSERVRRDPEDFSAQNRLAGYYLKRLRETSNLGFLELASVAARASLESLPAEANPGGLAALALTEHAAHNFTAARDHALQLTRLEPGKSYPYELLGDALLELGEYEKVTAVFQEMAQRSGSSVNTETRLARLALLHGENEAAKQYFSTALALALDLSPPPRETVAWCRWQLGETAFAGGDYKTAERHYRDALVTFADYPQALASLGRVRAARGDLAGAIESYRRAVRIFPDPAFIAALGDLYQLAGRDKNAAAQYTLVEKIGHLSTLSGAAYSRQLALFYADHDLKTGAAYASASKEYAVRRDIYGADALAWAALKAHRLSEAQAAIKQALRLGTRDAKLLYHAGMIARAAGDTPLARDYLKRALALNPQFDPLQAVIAERAMKGL